MSKIIPSRLLTKSLFKTGSECPTKLYYTKNDRFPSTKDENEFLEALAEGGIQVGELAKLYWPGGTEIEYSGKSKMYNETQELLQDENKIIYEAAIAHDQFFVLVDILIKEGNEVKLIEVKSKSYDPKEDDFFGKRKPHYISSDWRPYLLDVTFQYYVLSKAHPEWNITPYLMMMDKSKSATVDGLNQLFRIKKDSNGRAYVENRSDVPELDLGEKLMIEVNVKESVERILNGTDADPVKKEDPESRGFEEWIYTLAKFYDLDKQYPPPIGEKCKNCEFRINPSTIGKNEESGFRNCWKQVLDWDDSVFKKPHIFDIWNYRKAGKHMEEDHYLMEDIPYKDELANPSTVLIKEDNWESKERQALQIHLSLHSDGEQEIINPGLYREIEKWEFPLHFIDFEASSTALPFHKGQTPYEKTAFQFSIHTAQEDGTIEHRCEWIHTTPGIFPNFEFVRALKEALADQPGTIFQYSKYENSTLRQIYRQIQARFGDVPDAKELLEFIDELTYDKDRDWVGPRCMVDLWDIEKYYYYNTRTRGSNSIKQVLPAILNTSDYLQNKYSKATYQGKNFSDWRWVEKDENGRVKDPYKLLPPIDIDIPDEERITESIRDGGAAMVAWAKIQFMDTSVEEREAIRKGLLKYCELDTLAMVMIWEHWWDMAGNR